MLDNYSNNAILLKALSRRDLKAFEFLYQHSRNRLYVLALSILSDEDAARDLIQDLFIDLWYFRIFETITISLNAYLFQSVRNRAFNYKHKIRTQDRLKQNYAPRESETYYPLENEELGRIYSAACDAQQLAFVVWYQGVASNCHPLNSTVNEVRGLFP